MPTPLDALRRFETPGATRFVAGAGGLPRLEITTRLATAQIYLHGAHVTHYHPAGSSPLLFLSESSRFSSEKAIRGGVPIIFPWFGPHPSNPQLPMHGFARTSEFEVESVDLWSDQTCQATFRLVSNEASRALWPHDFILRFRVTVGRKLEMALEVENWSGGAFKIEEALHTYLAIRDIRQVAISGLQGVEYIDKVDNFSRKQENGTAIRFEKETDRVYLKTTSSCAIDDAVAGRVIRVGKEGSQTTVVWNPWEAKAAALLDLGDSDWLRFVCVETCNAADDAITLQHGETHTIRAVLSLDA